MPIRLILDENQRGRRLWNAIQTHNVHDSQTLDTIRVGDTNGPPNGILDPELIEYSINTSRIIVSSDVNTLIACHDGVVASGRWTPGLWIIKPKAELKELIESLVIHVYGLDPEECASRCMFLP